MISFGTNRPEYLSPFIQALDNSRRSQHQPKYLRIYESTKGIIFLGTPHRGSGSAEWAQIISDLARFALQDSNTSILRGLSPNSELLENLQNSFLQILEDGKIHVHSFYETMGMTGLYGLRGVVSRTMAFNQESNQKLT